MNYLKGLIKCECGKNYNFKLNRNTPCYICQNRKNKGVQECDSPIIKEEFLTDIIQQHCEIHSKDYSINKIKLFVKEIKINNDHIKILYKDGTYSEISFSGNIAF